MLLSSEGKFQASLSHLFISTTVSILGEDEFFNNVTKDNSPLDNCTATKQISVLSAESEYHCDEGHAIIIVLFQTTVDKTLPVWEQFRYGCRYRVELWELSSNV